MTISSGFFNSVSGDRKYNARHFNEIFDGMLKDGVYTTIGDQFNVTAGTGMQVIVGTGRGWFKNTWIYNDAPVPLNITSADPVYKRIDAIVIDIDTGTQVRNNDIKYIIGTAASTPDKPTLIDTPTHKQYPLAWIMVNAGVTAITSGNITDCKLTGEIPAVEAILEYSSHTRAEINERFNRDENPSFNDRTGALANIASGEAMTTMLGKIKQLFATLIGHTSSKATFYRHDGVFATPPTVDLTQPGYCPMLPAYSSGDHKYLRDDGTWVIPPNTQNNNAVAQNSAGNANENYKVMLTERAAAENAVEATKWDADLTYNPSTNQLNVKKIVGDSVNGVKFGLSGTNRGYYDANGNFKTFRQPTGNAGAAQVLSGYTFANASSDSQTGTMSNYSGSNRRTVTPSGGTGNEQLSLSAGYHDSVIVNRTSPYNAGIHAQKTVNWTEDFYLLVSTEDARAEAEFGLCDVYSWKITSKGSSVSYIKAAYKNSSGATVQNTFDVSVNTTYTPPSNAFYLVFMVYTSNTGSSSDRKAIGTFTKYADKLHT